MVFVKLILALAIGLTVLIGWSWLRANKTSRWVRRYRGTIGWIIAGAFLLAWVLLLKSLLPG